MRRLVLLDSGTLGMVSNPSGAVVNVRCKNWVDTLRASGIEVKVPEIAD
jgi:hypothetical protein